MKKPPAIDQYLRVQFRFFVFVLDNDVLIIQTAAKSLAADRSFFGKTVPRPRNKNYDYPAPSSVGNTCIKRDVLNQPFSCLLSGKDHHNSNPLLLELQYLVPSVHTLALN